MLLIQRLSALDCRGARLSPPGLGVHYVAPLPWLPRHVPVTHHPASAAAPVPNPSPRGGPGSGHPWPRGGRPHRAAAPAAPEPHLRSDLGDGVPPGVTIWKISGQTSPPRRDAAPCPWPRVPGPVHRARVSWDHQVPADPPGKRGLRARKHPGVARLGARGETAQRLRVTVHHWHGTKSGC